MEFTLNLLPAGGLASSVITTVWVGVMVVVFFNLRFGTTLSGLVVPGYLIPLFIVHPASGWVILIESVITYLIARVVADRGLVRMGLGEMFGRDRFFVLILISVLVRVCSDGFILPLLAEQLAVWGAPYELRSGLHSFGLIIIALCANQFWNGGIKVGAITLSVYLFFTYVIVSYVLMPLTNFNISTLGYMYEDIASSILASPKAYIILITAAFVSSRMNLRYGWDFNGILIPSLLALQWYDPFKILTTFFEAFVILFAAQAVMKLPVIRQINMEGARQLLLFFNVGFFYKLGLGFAIINWFPSFKVTDFYGFGYVLGTLMALKMYEKGIAIRFTRTTVQTSLTAIIMASLMGYAITFFASEDPAVWQARQGETLLQTSDASLSQFVADSRSSTYQSEGAKSLYSLSAPDVGAYNRLFRQTSVLTESSPVEQLNAIAYGARELGFITHYVEQRYLAFTERDPQNGRGFYLIDTHANSNLALEVPRALDEPKAAAVADRIYSQLGARYLAYSGARSNRNEDGSDDVLLNANSVFQLFHQAVGNNNALQIRGYTRRSARQLLGVIQDQQTLDLNIQKTSVWVKRSLPQHLPLGQLKQMLGGFDISWQTPSTQNRQRDTAINGFVEVYLNDQSLLSVYRQTAKAMQFTQVAEQQRIDGYLQSYLLEEKLEGKFNFAAKNSQSYVVADKYQLLYFDQAILQPVLNLIDQVAGNTWDQGHQSRLNQISGEAAQFGYQVLLYRHVPTGQQYLIFKELLAKGQSQNSRYWGTYAIKLNAKTDLSEGKVNYIVEVPMPIVEQNTFEFGTELFENLDARAILISATHPLANSDGSSQLTSSQNQDSLFNLFHQSLLRHYQHQSPFAVQVRGFMPKGVKEATQEAGKAVVAHFEHRKPGAQSHPGLMALKQKLQQNGLILREPDSEQIHQRFEARLNAQSRFTKYISSAQYAEVWLPAQLRYQFKRNSEDDLFSKKIAALELPILQVDVKQYLQQQTFSVLAQRSLTSLKSMLDQFSDSQNINQLLILKQTFEQVMLVQDNNSQLYYLLVSDANQRVQLVANLMPLNDDEQTSITKDAINNFVDNRQRYLIKNSVIKGSSTLGVNP